MRDNRDFNIEIRKNTQEEEHAHSSIEVFYLVTGTCSFTVSQQQYEMKQRDMILANAMEPHSYKADGILCIFSISYRTFLKFAPDGGCIFFLNSVRENRSVHEDIRYLLHEMIWLETGQMTDRECRIYRDFFGLMDILLLHCRDSSYENAAQGRHMPDDRKLQQVIAYVHSHYRDTISLSQLAKEMYVSTSTLSRFFKKQTGIYFADYVNQVRLAYAVGEMRYTDKNITRIAADCGFANPASFSGLFREYYGMSPNAYRKQEQARREEEKAKELALRGEVARELMPERAVQEQGGEIVVDTAATKRCSQPFRHIVNVGSMSALTRANVQYHLLYAVRELHVTHARIWSIFTEDLRITDGRSIGVYNYNSIDTVLDMLVENHIGVYFDFGRRPDMAVRTSDTSVFHEENAIRFATRREWEALLEDFVQHLVLRYGLDEVSGWYFDFNQDPSYRGGCAYSDDPEHTFADVWKHAWRTIRAYVPGAKVGGPVGTPNGPKQELTAFIKEAVRQKCVPDFLSLILFPYEPTKDYSSFNRVPGADYESRMIRAVEIMLKEEGLENLPIHISDWNLTLSTRNMINDSCQRGAYLASRAALMIQHTRVCSLWVLSDWVSSYFDSRSILNGGGGLLTRDSIRKPAWFALQFMSRLGRMLLYADQHLVVTMRGVDDYMILAVNSVNFDISYYLCEEDKIRADEVDLYVMEGESMTLRLVMKGLAEGAEYTVKTRSVNRQHGSILDEWKRLRCETHLERADIKYLQEICVPHMSMEQQTVEGEKLNVTIPLAPQEFRLLHIYRNR